MDYKRVKRRDFYSVIELARSLTVEPAEIVSLGALELLKIYIDVPDNLEIYLMDRYSSVEERKKSETALTMRRRNPTGIDDDYFMPLLVHDLRMLEVSAGVCSNLIGRGEATDRTSLFSSGWKYNQNNDVEKVTPRSIQMPANEKSFSLPLLRVFRTYAPVNAKITKREFFELPSAKVEIRIDGLYVLAEDLKSINLKLTSTGKIENRSAPLDAARSIIAKIMVLSESDNEESLVEVRKSVREPGVLHQTETKTRVRSNFSSLLNDACKIVAEPYTIKEVTAAFVQLLQDRDPRRYQFVSRDSEEIHCVIDGEVTIITIKQIRDWLNYRRKKQKQAK